MARSALQHTKPANGIAKDFRSALLSTGLITAFTLLTVLASMVRVPLPFSPVPITGQLFAVLLAGAFLGSTRGAFSQGLYLLWGISGLPLFAAGTVGLAALMGPTGGYLIAFVPAAILVGFLVKRSENYFHVWMSMFLASLLILGLGWLQLVLFYQYSPVTAFMLGVAPFLPLDIVKVCLAAGVVMGYRKVRKK